MQYRAFSFTKSGIFALALATVFSFAFVGNLEAAEDEGITCTTPTISNFTPHIFDTELHSFDYIVEADRKNVTITQTTLANDVLDARYSTKWAHEEGTRVHVEVPTWEGFSGTLSIVVHVKSGEDASCETREDFSVTTGIRAEEGAMPPIPAPTQNQNIENSNGNISISEAAKDANDDKKQGADAGETIASQAVGESCSTLSQLWWIGFVLLHVIIAGGVLFFLREQIEESNLWFATVLLVPFAAFLATWFIFDECRSNQWFPIAIALISLGTVLSVPDNDSRGGRTKKKKGGSIMLIPNLDEKKNRK